MVTTKGPSKTNPWKILLFLKKKVEALLMNQPK